MVVMQSEDKKRGEELKVTFTWTYIAHFSHTHTRSAHQKILKSEFFTYLF